MAVVDSKPFPMQVAQTLLNNELAQTSINKVMPKKTVKKSTKKVAKKAAKKAAAKKIAKKVIKKTAKKAAKKTVTKKATKKVAKKVAKKAAKKVAQKRSLNTPSQNVSSEQINHAAYLNFISRIEQGIHGDEHGDWLAAEAALRNTQK
jgi:outer membrane biosynthesis protein TonB